MAALGGSRAVAGEAGEDAILKLPSWSTTLGRPVAATPYGMPSKYETAMLRRPSPGLTQVAGSSVSFMPLQGMFGIITPSGLHFERHHQGWQEIDPSQHRLMVHGMSDDFVRKPKVYTLDDLMRIPSVSRMHFIECGANTGMEWGNVAVPTVQYTHGMLSCSEFTGVPLRTLLEDCGADLKKAKFVLAEGADGSSMTRTIPIELVMSGEVIVAYGQNGEMLRPENGYPLRLVVPGVQGVSWVKWLRRIKVGDQPWATKDEAVHYIDLMPDGQHRQYTSIQECKSVITSPSGGQTLLDKGLYNVTGLAWSGRGKIKRVDVSFDGGVNWVEAQLQTPVLSKCLTRFNVGWKWDGGPRPAAIARHRRDRLCPARLPATARGARHPLDLSQQRHPESGRSRRAARSAMSRFSKSFRTGGRARLRRRPLRAMDDLAAVGRPATPAEIKAWDIDVRPDFAGLPKGSGSVEQGEAVFEEKCASCHGSFGESNKVFSPLVGGVEKSDLATGHVAALMRKDFPARTTFMKVATVSTLFDYIRRAMPWNAPKSLSDDQVYAVLAYLLNLSDIVPSDFVLNEQTIRDVQKIMPNRNGMTFDHAMWPSAAFSGKPVKPDTANTPCMKKCKTAPEIGFRPARSRQEFARQSGGSEPPRWRSARASRPRQSRRNSVAAEDRRERRLSRLPCGELETGGPRLCRDRREIQGRRTRSGKLIAKIRAGGAGVWGDIAMPRARPKSRMRI